ncbi:hypothetical protein ACFP81_12330 [Deinococcus lacus]|uniref:Uncharacterized protein n=1 Tax=Deinococcus lacus TaxID=392561 RepID=A0ABW1YE99_9DEIO
MGRRRLPPVKLYRVERVEEAENDELFLSEQIRTQEAREKRLLAAEKRRAAREMQLEAAARRYRPAVQPLPLRRGAVRQARSPYLPELERTFEHLKSDLGRLTPAEEQLLRALLLERLHTALAAAYDWYRAGKPASPPAQAAKPSDWREWDWD